MYIFFRWSFMNLLLWTSLHLNFEMPNTRKHHFFPSWKYLCISRLHKWPVLSKSCVQTCSSRKSDGFTWKKISPCASPACDHWFMWIAWLSGGMGHEAEWSYLFYAGEKNTKNSYFNTWNYPEKNIQEHNLIISFQWMIKKFLVSLSFYFLKMV